MPAQERPRQRSASIFTESATAVARAISHECVLGEAVLAVNQYGVKSPPFRLPLPTIFRFKNGRALSL
jgi:hypothetical protein